MATPNFAENPLVKASGGKVTPAQIEAYYQKTGSLPRWREGPEGPIISSSSFAKDIGWQNPGTIQSVVGTTASKAATSGTPGSGVGSVYVPNSVNEAIQNATTTMQGATQAGQGQFLADLYQNAGVTDMMAQAAYNPSQPFQGSGPVVPPVPSPGVGLPPDPAMNPRTMPDPTRGQRGAPLPGTPEAAVPVGANLPTLPVGSLAPGSFQTPQQFAEWFSGQGPAMAGQLGEVYGMPAPVMTAAGEYMFPGMAGQTFGTGADNALLAERVQAQQLLTGRQSGTESNLYGPISPLIPPHLIGQAGYGPESVLGGQYSLGQTAAADPSLQGMVNQGALDWYGSQTPSGPYAGFQFPQHFDQPQGGATTNLPAGSGTNFNPGQGFGQPGQYQPGGSGGGGGTFQPVPGSGGGGGGGSFNPNPFPPGGGGGGTGSGAGGGTGGGAGGANPFPPISVDTGTSGGGIGAPSSADAFLADSTNDVGYLRGIAENAGYATDQTAAWEAMVAAQQRNIERMGAQLGEQFNVSGNRFSSVFGDAMTDYYGQAGLDQNSLLAQMTLASQEAARGRELQAAGQLGQQGHAGASQLSNQGFQAAMQQGQQSYGTAMNMFNASQNAASQLLNNSMLGAQQLFGAENEAGMAEANRQMQLIELMLGTAGNLSQDWQRNLLTGSALGEQQYGMEQNAIDQAYNEFLRTQPEYNPLIPYLYSGATGYPPTAYPQYQPNYAGQLAGGFGGIMGLLAQAGVFGGGGGNQNAVYNQPGGFMEM